MGEKRLAAYPKKASDTHAHFVLIDETGLFLNPVVRRTWSIIGHTPVIDADGGHRDKVSVIGGVSVSPTAQRLGFYFATDPNGFFTAEKVVPFLRDLLKHLRGNVIVVWDRGNNHKGPIIRKFLRKNRRLVARELRCFLPELDQFLGWFAACYPTWIGNPSSRSRCGSWLPPGCRPIRFTCSSPGT